MALIKCKECGQMISDKASACPHCGCPVSQVKKCDECGEIIPDNLSICPNCGCPIEKQVFVIQDETASQPSYHGSNNSKSLWIIVALILLLLIGLGFMFFNQKKSDSNEETTSTSENLEQSKQDCLKLENPKSEKQNNAVAELKSLLAKTDGMKFGNSELQMTSSRYDEENNVVEFHFIQRIFPQSEETPQLLNEMANASRSTRKKALRKVTNLIKLMEPLRPVIRDVVCYPDGQICYSYEFSFNDLYLDDDVEDNNDNMETSSLEDSQKMSGWNFLKNNYPEFAGATLNKYVPPTAEPSIELAKALDYPGLSVATYQSTSGDTYVVVFTNGTPRTAFNALTAHGDMNTWKSALRYILEE